MVKESKKRNGSKREKVSQSPDPLNQEEKPLKTTGTSLVVAQWPS
jgi:hypothetical protein